MAEIIRVWAMPDKWTFRIKPIAELLAELNVGDMWVDPFAGSSRLAEFSNDIRETEIDAYDFIREFESNSILGVLLDPPYSAHQRVVSYNDQGKHIEMTWINNEAARIVMPGGLAVSFGWNSNGLGAKRGFVREKVLLIAHGGHHNDTIVTIERKK